MTSSPFSSVSSSFSSWLLLLLDIFKNSLTPPLLSKSADPEFAPQTVSHTRAHQSPKAAARPSLKSRVEVTAVLSCQLQHFVDQVGGGRWGLGVPSVTVSPQLAPSPSFPPPVAVQTGLCHWPSSPGKLPWSPSLTIRKWFTNWPILSQRLGFPSLVFSFEYLESSTNSISTGLINKLYLSVLFKQAAYGRHHHSLLRQVETIFEL